MERPLFNLIETFVNFVFFTNVILNYILLKCLNNYYYFFFLIQNELTEWINNFRNKAICIYKIERNRRLNSNSIVVCNVVSINLKVRSY